MIKIAFCDDDLEVLHQMNELLDRYRVERNEDITYAAFQSPFELLTEIEKGIRPDILFLDVVMPGQNGMDVAKEIGVSDASIIRFARAIGYLGFTDLKNDIYNSLIGSKVDGNASNGT